MTKSRVLFAMALLLAPAVLATTDAAYANSTTVPRKCINGVCASVKYYGGRVRISLSSKLSRTTHFNFQGDGGAQIELTSGSYSFDAEPGASGTYNVQACERGGIGARSTCTKWATFEWNSGAQEEEEEQ